MSAPAASSAGRDGVDGLADLLREGRVLVLSGAGMSTGSGIPDYRGPTGARRRGSPMTYADFTGSADGRRRYWARSYVGWWQIATAQPNSAHLAVAQLQRLGVIRSIITQNVDGLHQAAGSTSVVELHGTLDRVVCLDCGSLLPRAQLDRRLRAANPGFAERATAVADELQVNPDGDVDLPESVVADFVVVPCPVCEVGVLKPDVVFFGENVPKDRVARCFEALEAARVLLVLGSSLTVMSGYRFVRAAARAEQPVAIVNAGPTRGDGEASVRLDAPLGEVLPALVERLGGEG